MRRQTKSRYFDLRAENWNRNVDIEHLARVIKSGLQSFGIRDDEVVMDLGCGTGALTRVLLEHLSGEGRVIAVDFAPQMIDHAKRAIEDPRVTWLCNDVRRIRACRESVDRVIAFSAWPHFERPGSVIAEAHRLLRREGRLHIWHKDSRAKVNAVHARCGAPVDRDTLPPAVETARLLTRHGFCVHEVIDTNSKYLVSASKV